MWDDFLAFHYTGRPFELAARAVVVPEPGTAITARGAGPMEISPIRVSGLEAASGQPVLLSAEIRGQEIGYIYLFAGFYDPDANSIFVADTDYLESDDTREIDGVYYPDRREGAFTLEFEWEPLLFAIDDGTDTVVALFTPERYGTAPEEAIYSVEGIFTYASSVESRYARLLFQDGVLRQVFGFTSQDGTGAPREIIPQPGDQFTVLEKWMDLDASGRVAQTVRQVGGSLVFGNQMFRWEEVDAAPGEYIVGFLVEDLDGNRVEAYETIRVAE